MKKTKKKPQKVDKEIQALEKELEQIEKSDIGYGGYLKPDHNSGMSLIGTWSAIDIIQGEVIALFQNENGAIYKLGTHKTEKGNNTLVLRKLQTK